MKTEKKKDPFAEYKKAGTRFVIQITVVSLIALAVTIINIYLIYLSAKK